MCMTCLPNNVLPFINDDLKIAPWEKRLAVRKSSHFSPSQGGDDPRVAAPTLCRSFSSSPVRKKTIFGLDHTPSTFRPTIRDRVNMLKKRKKPSRKRVHPGSLGPAGPQRARGLPKPTIPLRVQKLNITKLCCTNLWPRVNAGLNPRVRY